MATDKKVDPKTEAMRADLEALRRNVQELNARLDYYATRRHEILEGAEEVLTKIALATDVVPDLAEKASDVLSRFRRHD